MMWKIVNDLTNMCVGMSETPLGWLVTLSYLDIIIVSNLVLLQDICQVLVANDGLNSCANILDKWWGGTPIRNTIRMCKNTPDLWIKSARPPKILSPTFYIGRQNNIDKSNESRLKYKYTNPDCQHKLWRATVNWPLYTVACQGGGVSSKTRRHGADKTRSLNPLVRWHT